MKKRLFRKLFALSLSLALVLVLAACSPEITIVTDSQADETASAQSENAIASAKDSTPQAGPTKSEVDTSVASSESQKIDSSSDKTGSTASKSTSSKASNSAAISKSKAKSIALDDAGLKASDIYDYEVELDRDDGVLHYDISFESGGKDYDYEINAETGKIISADKPNATSSEVKISKSKAKSTALSHAGVKAADISQYQIELEKDDGVWKYEISFRNGNVEYDYTINAETGKIIESEKDIDD